MSVQKKLLFLLLGLLLTLATACSEGGGGGTQQEDKVGENGACNATKLCDTNLLCIATDTTGTTGTCRKEKTCTVASAAQDCTETGKTSCNEVQGIGSQLHICGAPIPPKKKAEGETCTAADACETDLVCIATDAMGTTGTCKKEKTCTVASASNDCTETGKTSCNKVQGIGTQLHICGAPIKKHEGEKCTAADTCDTDLKCIGKTATEGICKKEIVCTPETESILCSSKGYEKCVGRKLVADGSDVKVCDAGDYTTKVVQNGSCFDDEHCATGLKCMKALGSSAGRCEAVTECTEANKGTVCTEDGKKDCVKKQTINGTEIHVCDGATCNATTPCSDPTYICYPKDDKFKEGTCKKVCTKDSDCSTGEACKKSLLGIGGSSFMINACLPKSGKVDISGFCTHHAAALADKVVCETGLVCAVRHEGGSSGNCANKCTKEGYNSTDCPHPGASYCAPSYISIPAEPTNISPATRELVCGPVGFIKDGSKNVGEECDETSGNTMCQGHLLCVKENASDAQGKCYEHYRPTTGCASPKVQTTATPDLILPYSDHDIEYCK